MSSYKSEYQKLNSEQKEAVNTIEGPVMVIAGAGTGKTQTIALRIGKIREETQVNPSNILCLTFTENAALNMRQRLLELIGADAYGVRIATFHAFCNSIIKDYPQYFLKSALESKAIDDITKIEVIRSLIDKLPQSSPFFNLNYPYFYQKEIISSISSLKKENISPLRFEELIKDAANFVLLASPLSEKLKELRASPKSAKTIISLIKTLSSQLYPLPLYQVRINYFLQLYESETLTLSEIKQKTRDFIDKSSDSLIKIRDLLVIYKYYQEELTRRGLYDYEDMILWVIVALQTHPELLLTYQENYQYLLVDEFQDTNSSQMEILNLLVKNQNNPNIFVVGDDDQSIYRFQGANVENLYSFYQKYKKTLKVIVLKNNYRSHQLILDSSTELINHNQIRISQYIGNIDKSLIATKDYDPDPINLFVGDSNEEENYWVVKKIKTLLESGEKANEIAILYRNNADINDLLSFLSQNEVLYLRSDGVNILETLEIEQLLTLLRYLASPSDNTLLAHLLSFNFLRLPSSDLYRLFILITKEKLILSEVIFDKQFLKENKFSLKFIKRINRFTDALVKTQKDANNLVPDELFNLIIRRFNYLNYLLKTKNISLLKQLNTLYSHLKQSLSIQKISLFDWVNKLSLLSENNLALNSPPLQSDFENSIHLMTVHKAKGLEFDHVFIIKVLSEKWDKSSSRSLIKLPLGVLLYDIEADILEEDRRLFYVALTRAKKQIYLSYSRFNDSRKEQLASRFISEINQKFIEKKSSDPAIEKNTLLTLYHPSLPKIKSTVLSSYLKNYLSTSYRFNITHLNSYLKCPLCFFFKTILHLPYPKAKAMSFGTAVHGALAYLTQVYKKENFLINQEKFLSIFNQNLKRENLSPTDFEQLKIHGREILTAYYQHYKESFNGNCLIEHDFKFKNVRLGNIPLTGKIDKIEFLSGNQVNVVDYKTGKPDSKSQQLSPEGDYFRQLVFYKLLCSEAKGFPYEVVSGTIDFIEKNSKDQFVRKNYLLTSDNVNKLKSQITEVFDKIVNLDFTPNPKCEDKDHLHYLFEKYFK